jgi:hypothetical protein
MNNLVEYIIFGFFAISLIKGYFKGGTSESIFLFFFLLACASAYFLFSPDYKKMLLSAIVFIAIYCFGAWLAQKYKYTGSFEKFSGALIGAINFFIFLSLSIALSLYFESFPPAFANNRLVEISMPFAKYLYSFISFKLA